MLRYLWVLGGGLLAFGLFWFVTGARAGPGFGSEILVGIGGFSAVMGLVLILIAFYYRNIC